MSKGFYVCECFYNKNYFLEKFNLHTDYYGNGVLDDALKQSLLQKSATNEDLNDALMTLLTERNRRESLGNESLKRIEVIKSTYTPLHPYLYKLQKSFLDPSFVTIAEYAKTSRASLDGLSRMMEPMICDQVWRFPVFTQTFCKEFIEELIHVENSDIPKGRPNTMNHHGILLNEIGFDEQFLIPLREDYLSPIAKLLLPDWFGEGLDSQKSFTVKYKEDEDVDLAYHFDNAEITLNVCLGKHFDDGSLYFGNMRNEPADLNRLSKVRHRVGHGILHRGQHRHGAMPISGDDCERHNLIIWMRSSSIRNSFCPMCGCKPTLAEVAYGGDGFVKEDKGGYCKVT